jgi:hypothetical protein
MICLSSGMWSVLSATTTFVELVPNLTYALWGLMWTMNEWMAILSIQCMSVLLLQLLLWVQQLCLPHLSFFAIEQNAVLSEKPCYFSGDDHMHIYIQRLYTHTYFSVPPFKWPSDLSFPTIPAPFKQLIVVLLAIFSGIGSVFMRLQPAFISRNVCKFVVLIIAIHSCQPSRFQLMPPIGFFLGILFL